MTTQVKTFIIMKDCNRYESGQYRHLDSCPDIAVTVDADESINADKPQEFTPNDGKIPYNDHHSTKVISVEMDNWRQVLTHFT